MPDFSSLGALIALAILTEATIQFFIMDTPAFVSAVVKNTEFTPDFSPFTLRCISAVIAIAYAYNMNLDIFELLGFPSRIPYIGIIATGIIASRGSNFVHDFIKRYYNRTNIT